MLIRVTQEHIDRSLKVLGRTGTFNDKFHDPITLAIRSALNAKRVMTHPFYAEVDGNWYRLSKLAISWSYDWCKGIVGQPFEFSIISDNYINDPL